MTLGELTENQMLVGLVGATLTGGLMYALRSSPVYIREILRFAFTVRLQIRGDDDAYQWVTRWLSKHPYMKSARRIRMTSDNETGEVSIEPAPGKHLIWVGMWPIWVDRVRDEKPAGTTDGPSRRISRLQEHYEITFIGRSQAQACKFLGDITGQYHKDRGLDVRLWNGWWDIVRGCNLRSLSSIFMNGTLINDIIQDAQYFFDDAEWYSERGIPYHRGYLFYGQPGTGKTSLVKAMASHFDRPICYIRLSCVENDKDLLTAFISAPKNAIILMEDIDTLKTTHIRHDIKHSDEHQSEAAPGVTLGGLLNTLDGIISVDGRLVIMTTNKPDVLDEALLRPGRVDMKYEFKALDQLTATRMIKTFYPDMPTQQLHELLNTGVKTAAEWQKILMSLRGRDINSSCSLSMYEI